MNVSELTRFKIMLLARKEELQEFEAAFRLAAQPVEPDQATMGRLSHIDATQSQQMAQETRLRRQSELEQVEGALRRIASGDYGYCFKCDEEMELKRLEANPTLTRCMNCS